MWMESVNRYESIEEAREALNSKEKTKNYYNSKVN